MLAYVCAVGARVVAVVVRPVDADIAATVVSKWQPHLEGELRDDEVVGRHLDVVAIVRGARVVRCAFERSHHGAQIKVHVAAVAEAALSAGGTNTHYLLPGFRRRKTHRASPVSMLMGAGA